MGMQDTKHSSSLCWWGEGLQCHWAASRLFQVLAGRAWLSSFGHGQERACVLWHLSLQEWGTTAERKAQESLAEAVCALQEGTGTTLMGASIKRLPRKSTRYRKEEGDIIFLISYFGCLTFFSSLDYTFFHWTERGKLKDQKKGVLLEKLIFM